MDKHFIVKLIETLKNNQIYDRGITIPYLLGACKIHEKDGSPVTLEYIKQTFATILSNSSRELFISTCTNVDNHYIISLMGGKEDDGIRVSIRCGHLDNEKGTPIIYFEEFFDCQDLSLENVCEFFWKKYEECFIYETYSYTNIGWVEIDPNSKEYQLISNI